jgi:antitoxin CptB
MSESPQIRLKRLYMRSIRRGTKEMDIVLGHFAAERLPGLDAATLDLYEALLDEADADLYRWVSGQAPAPAPFADLLAEIAQTARLAAPD